METYILDAVCVRLVLHDGVGWQVEHPAQGVADAARGGLVAGRLVPDGDDVLLEGGTHRGYDTLRVTTTLSSFLNPNQHPASYGRSL